MKMKYKDITENEEVLALIGKGNENLGVLGYTDHSEVHAEYGSLLANDILKETNRKQRL